MQNNPFPQPICDQIWNDKYRLITPNLDIRNDNSVQDTWDRIARACAEDDQELYNFLYNALEDFKFLPAGRITAGAGSGRNVTLFNCYVMGTIPDSMGGIFDMLKEAALTMQQGGGIGYDFTTLRPKDSPVKGVDADASGPLTFMDVWDAMCRTVMSAGSRRGAMMATMRCDHPDIEDFITAKSDTNRLRMFNVSVLATDEFMSCVKNDADWPLMHEVPPAEPVTWNNVTQINGKHIYKVIRAKDLWETMMKSTYAYAEPGVLFIDRINNMNNLHYCEYISATNPCGEQPLPPYGACLLGSVNLVKMVDDPFEKSPMVNQSRLEETVRAAVRLLDKVIDISNFPIPEQKAEALYKRRMGLGITGLADMLFMMNLNYNSQDGINLAERVMKIIAITAYEESIELAKEFGPCPATETKEQREAFCKSGFMKQMPEHIHLGVMEHGIRNALLTSIAPTGTISLYAGNVSSGIEPVFAPSYTRKVLEKDGSKREELVEDYAVKLYHEWRENIGMNKEPNPPHLVTAQTLDPLDHILMQSAVQKWVDSSISKTINVPEDISFEDFERVYTDAYAMGCKGCTTYRPNEVTGSILSIEKDEPEKTDEAPNTFDESAHQEYFGTADTAPRQRMLDGQTYKLKWEGSNFYVTINNRIQNGRLTPFEIFINTQDMSHFQWTVALTRMMSSVFRRNSDIQFVIKDLKSIMDPNGGAWVDGKYMPSFIALLGRTLEQHLDFLSDGGQTTGPDEEINFDPQPTVGKPMQCTQCKGFNVHLAGGCPVCADCGHSKCG